jgi:hypothetical protein
MMEAVRTSETSVDNNFTRQYIPEDNSEHHCLQFVIYMYHIGKKLLIKVGDSNDFYRMDFFLLDAQTPAVLAAF